MGMKVIFPCPMIMNSSIFSHECKIQWINLSGLEKDFLIELLSPYLNGLSLLKSESKSS